MRVVLDTNVLMSGIFWSGPPARILEAWSVLLPAIACDDPDDVKFLACAIAGMAACVVSGDRALLRGSGYEGVEVVRPKDFLKNYLDE
jgi:predicted nucleic acid-binding protein